VCFECCEVCCEEEDGEGFGELDDSGWMALQVCLNNAVRG
jgi:hypothetical protein